MRRDVVKFFSEMTMTSDGGFVFAVTEDTTSYHEHARWKSPLMHKYNTVTVVLVFVVETRLLIDHSNRT